MDITGDVSKPLYYMKVGYAMDYLNVLENRNGRYNYIRLIITALILIVGIVFFLALDYVSRPDNPPLAPPVYSHGWWDAEGDSVSWANYSSSDDMIINVITGGNIISRDGAMLLLIHSDGKWIEVSRTVQ